VAKRPLTRWEGIVLGKLALERDRSRAEPLLAQLRGGARRWQDLTDPEQRLLLQGPLIGYLLEKSYSCRFDDPQRMVALAKAACAVADDLKPRRYGRYVVADLRAQAWAELANAYRVAEEFDSAGMAFARVFNVAGQGTLAPELLARLFELMALYRANQRHFLDAIPLFNESCNLYRVGSEPAGLENSLANLAWALGEANEPERAVMVYLHALRGMRQDSPNRLACIHGLALNLVESGNSDLAQNLLRRHPRLYRRTGKLNEYRRFWLEGKIAVGLHEYGKAEAKLNTARLAFLRVEQTFDAALVSLDLAWVYAKEGRRQEVVWLVEEMLRTFLALGIARESVASLLLLKKSCEQRRSVEVLCVQIEALAKLLPELTPVRGKKTKAS
jgi:tetratricopeptide (TPR) repeat protein